MKILKTPHLAFLFLAIGVLHGGCTMNSQKDTSIPWSRPANWEGQIPGIGTTPGSGR